MEGKWIYDVEVSDNGTPVFGYYTSNNALLSSDAELRLQVLHHLAAATDYLRKTLSPATGLNEAGQ